MRLKLLTLSVVIALTAVLPGAAPAQAGRAGTTFTTCVK